MLDDGKQKQRGKQNENLNMVLGDYKTRTRLELSMKIMDDQKLTTSLLTFGINPYSIVIILLFNPTCVS